MLPFFPYLDDQKNSFSGGRKRNRYAWAGAVYSCLPDIIIYRSCKIWTTWPMLGRASEKSKHCNAVFIINVALSSLHPVSFNVSWTTIPHSLPSLNCFIALSPIRICFSMYGCFVISSSKITPTLCMSVFIVAKPANKLFLDQLRQCY